MRAWLLLGLLPLASATGQAGAELHVSKVGEGPDFVALRFPQDVPPLRLEAFLSHVMPPTALPDIPSARLFGEPTDAGQTALDLGELKLPAHGRHLLLLSRSGDGRVRTRLLPFDRENLPLGGVQFLNLTSRKMRCSIENEAEPLVSYFGKLTSLNNFLTNISDIFIFCSTYNSICNFAGNFSF